MTNTQSLQSIENTDLTKATGLIRIPVCGFFEAAEVNAKDPENASGNAFWPCPYDVAEGHET